MLYRRFKGNNPCCQKAKLFVRKGTISLKHISHSGYPEVFITLKINKKLQISTKQIICSFSSKHLYQIEKKNRKNINSISILFSFWVGIRSNADVSRFTPIYPMNFPTRIVLTDIYSGDRVHASSTYKVLSQIY